MMMPKSHRSPQTQALPRLQLEDLLHLFDLPTIALSSLSPTTLPAIEVHGFALGDVITLDRDSVGSSEIVGIVLEGRVRAIDGDIPIAALDAGRVWTSDAGHRFGRSLSLVGATEGCYACLSIEALAAVGEVMRPLCERLAKERALLDRLIFFKSLAGADYCPSHRLREWAGWLQEDTIAAGTNLGAWAADRAGRFWLQAGQIDQRALALGVAALPLKPGQAWGYPEAPPQDWQAATELAVYWLPADLWSATQQLVPELTGGETIGPVHRSRPRLSAAAEIAVDRGIPRSESIAPEPPAAPRLIATQKPQLAFPQPTPRHSNLWQGYPFVAQQSSSDCGAACLAMVGLYWGHRLSLNVLRDRAGVARSGASLKGLAKAADSIGFQTQAVRASLDAIADRRDPWIAHWDGNHYVVVYRVRGNRVILADPALGKRSIDRAEFVQHWTGYALLLEGTDRLANAPTQQRSIGTFARLLVPHRGTIAQILALSLLIQVLGLVSPLLTQTILDKVVTNQSLDTLNVFALGMLICGVWAIGTSSARQYLLQYLSNRLDLTSIGGFIRHALSLPLKFFEDRRVGDILTRVQENQKVQQFLIGRVLLAWLDLLTGGVYLVLMLYYNWQLTLLVLCLIPPIALLTLASTPLLRRLSREVFHAAADQNSLLVELLDGVPALKSAAAEQDLRWRWEDRLTKQLNAQFAAQKTAIGLGSAGSLIQTLGNTALLWYGAKLAIGGELSIGQFVAFNMMIGYVLQPVLQLSGLWDELQEVWIAIERLNDVFEREPEENPQHPMLVMPPIQGEVRFEQVTFRYDDGGDRDVLTNLSFTIAPGERVAIVGTSGSGKSTLVKLLQGFYHPSGGRICIDGHDITRVLPQSLRQQIGVVPQECFLFSGSAAENITLFDESIPLAAAIEAAKLAEAHDFIQSMPLGYNTPVGEKGSHLSGGQRQRIAIARALLGNPRLLILDEATSSLDAESERRFQNNLETFSRDRTTFVVAHRLATVRNADRILVLDRGSIVESGKHDDLVAAQGLYYHLARQQLSL